LNLAFKYFPKYNEERIKRSLDNFKKTLKLESPDKKLIVELGNIAKTYGSITVYYLVLLKEGKQKLLNLIKGLQTSYNID